MLTATSFCVLPVNGLDGIPLRDTREVSSRIQREWIDLVGLDFIAQAEERAAWATADPAATPAYS